MILVDISAERDSKDKCTKHALFVNVSFYPTVLFTNLRQFNVSLKNIS